MTQIILTYPHHSLAAFIAACLTFCCIVSIIMDAFRQRPTASRERETTYLDTLG